MKKFFYRVSFGSITIVAVICLILVFNREEYNFPHLEAFKTIREPLGPIPRFSAAGKFIHFNREVSEPSSQFLLEKTEEEYILTLFNPKGEVLFRDAYPEEPSVSEITSEILGIGVSTGSPSFYVWFFNKTTGEISRTFFNPVIFGNQYLAYMEDRLLILTDIFENGSLHEEISRPFSETANPMSAIISIDKIDDYTILLRYYSGLNLEETSEEIKVTAEQLL